MNSIIVALALGAAWGEPIAPLASVDIPPGAIRHSTPLASEVAFALSSQKALYLVGEGLSLTFAVNSIVDFPIRAGLDLNPLLGAARLYCRRGSADFVKVPLYERYRDIAGDELRPLNPGDVRRFSFTVAIADRVAAIGRFLLHQPGVYQCRVSYADTGDDPNGLLESNVITFDVTSPTGADLEALGALSPEMACLAEVKTACFVSPASVSLADQFLRDHGTSLYAPAIRYGLRGYLRPRVITSRATSEEIAIWERHFEGGDTVRPVIASLPTLSSLWPPNKKMVAVTMDVNASDDSGTAPTIKLLSITCNDACNPTNDIAEAAYGTDDRAFELRADRTGGGKDRIYTITYEATDAAGNKATATTTVVVPHDQGKMR